MNFLCFQVIVIIFLITSLYHFLPLFPSYKASPKSVLQFSRLLQAKDERQTSTDAVNVTAHNELFHYVKKIQVLGPSIFPKPTDAAKTYKNEELIPFLKPVMGQHRPNQDAVLAFAAEFELKFYVLFIESLRRTGFTGDIVLSVSEIDLKNENIKAYLSSDLGVIVYAPKLVCYNFERHQVESVKGGARICQCHELWARRQQNDNALIPITDPRPARTIATTRYEIYWIMALNYNPDSWFLLVDSRDTIFQSNPFTNVPRQTDPSGKSGLVYLFGENVDATRLGLSKQNKKWLTNAYGDHVATVLENKPTICSGATMGEQVALETYMRAMVSESDETGVVLIGADQGFHNFLHYSHKLGNAENIHQIVVFDQGFGIVNNMGALRTKPLDEWGNKKIIKKMASNHSFQYHVCNWNEMLSPVVHQYDRHKELSSYYFKVFGDELMRQVQPRMKHALHIMNGQTTLIV